MFSKSSLLKHLSLILSAGLLLLSLGIYPLGLFRLQSRNASLEKGMAVSAPITDSSAMAGIFHPVHNRLDSIGFRFYVPGSSDNPGYIRLTLKDQYNTVLSEKTVPIHEIKNNSYYEFRLNKRRVKPGDPYVFEMNAYEYGDTAPCIYLGSPDVASGEHQTLYYNGMELPGNAPIAVYTYYAKASLQQALPYLIVIFSLGLLFVLSCPADEEAFIQDSVTEPAEDTVL